MWWPKLQILFFSALAFALLLLSGIYPAEIRCVNLDADWIYRKGGRFFYGFTDVVFNTINRISDRLLVQHLTTAINRFAQNVPALLSRWVLMPFYRLKGRGFEAVDNYRRGIQHAFDAGVVPLGISAAISGLFFILLFWLR
jgi:multicomponent Na+:H+ antiporter subunit D